MAQQDVFDFMRETKLPYGILLFDSDCRVTSYSTSPTLCMNTFVAASEKNKAAIQFVTWAMQRGESFFCGSSTFKNVSVCGTACQEVSSVRHSQLDRLAPSPRAGDLAKRLQGNDADAGKLELPVS